MILSDLLKITKITDQIYVSGIFPLDDNHHIIKKMGIQCIVSCVDRDSLNDIHSRIMVDNPEITILYLPYCDELHQNLWIPNQNKISFMKYIKTTDDYNKMANQVNQYNNKPLIEIGYHFINDAITNYQKILVHCMAGVSRSISLVSYYLMKKYFLNFDEAINIIKSKRRIANPNDSFKLQLQGYQDKRDQFTEWDANHIISWIVSRK